MLIAMPESGPCRVQIAQQFAFNIGSYHRTIGSQLTAWDIRFEDRPQKLRVPGIAFIV